MSGKPRNKYWKSTTEKAEPTKEGLEILKMLLSMGCTDTEIISQVGSSFRTWKKNNPDLYDELSSGIKLSTRRALYEKMREGNMDAIKLLAGHYLGITGKQELNVSGQQAINIINNETDSIELLGDNFTNE